MFHTTEYKDLIWEILKKKTVTTEEIAWIEIFLKDKANVGIRDKWGDTLLHMAARNGHLEVVRLLIEKGAHINAKAYENRTPLHVAALNGHLQVVQLLIEKGADIEAKNNKGTTTVYLAALPGHFEVVRLLIEKGANIQIKNNHGRTPLYAAASNGNLKMLQLMIEEVEIKLPKEEIIELISNCINSNKKKEENNSTLLPVILVFETDVENNLPIILKYYEDLKKATPINLLINLSNICTDPRNKKTLDEKIIQCAKSKPPTPFEWRLFENFIRNPKLVDINFLLQLKRENEIKLKQPLAKVKGWCSII